MSVIDDAVKNGERLTNEYRYKVLDNILGDAITQIILIAQVEDHIRGNDGIINEAIASHPSKHVIILLALMKLDDQKAYEHLLSPLPSKHMEMVERLVNVALSALKLGAGKS